MDFEFNARIGKTIEKSVKGAVRRYREQQKTGDGDEHAQTPPSYESFIGAVSELMSANKSAELNKLRTPNLRELFERAWAQKLRNYSTQEQFREAYAKLLRRYSK